MSSFINNRPEGLVAFHRHGVSITMTHGHHVSHTSIQRTVNPFHSTSGLVTHPLCTILKVLAASNQLKLNLPICLVDDGLDMPSSIYNTRAITRVSVVIVWVKTSTHYQGEVLLTSWLFVYIFIHKQST